MPDAELTPIDRLRNSLEWSRPEPGLGPAALAEFWLTEVWKDLSGSGEWELAQGMIEGMYRVGVLDETQRLWWMRRITVCPGHAGQSWCAYDGDVCRYCGEAHAGKECPKEECKNLAKADGW